ncbi:uroporphyrinogen-III synthase [Erythrobacter arachoides]|uniref:Uroporphyrinogen-III synthase n=1 Tax=Aurantiacibacter arachoides TaxID=1850444 RepID=A0A845A306_9SPHN|nr:uroporphyrinogen-III synthase [Aurantiacibacter arachoides]MXO93802.1 uroporphyrinogen-III synthase [Aurantiacibacter arachoides]GGD46568.1 uroporphyrinogen III methyltransferase [Aurantiacibacter arachoides]
MIFAIRPEPGLQATLQRGRDMNLAVLGRPLFEVVPLRWQAPPPEQFDALLIGSANAVRQAGIALEAYRHLPVHAVGEATADAAREAGLTVAHVGTGGLQQVLNAEKGKVRFLRLAGAEHIALKHPRRIAITVREVYDVRSIPLTGGDEVSLRVGEPVVLLHSAAAASHFARECERRGLDKGRIGLACIGPRVAKAAGRGWKACQSAPRPDDAALLSLAANMCH